jgi:hypothetical protein
MDAWTSFKRKREMRKVRQTHSHSSHHPTQPAAFHPLTRTPAGSCSCMQIKRATGVKAGRGGRRATGTLLQGTLPLSCALCLASVAAHSHTRACMHAGGRMVLHPKEEADVHSLMAQDAQPNIRVWQVRGGKGQTAHPQHNCSTRALAHNARGCPLTPSSMQTSLP